MNFFRKYNPDKAPKPLFKEGYDKDIANFDSEDAIKRARAAFDKAWETRNFEIDLYWRRTNYFWAFQIPVFGAYFALVTSHSKTLPVIIVYLVCCIGIITSLAWKLINVGSKDWQRHWENHIDHLEDNFTGPLYKTVSKIRTYSVSKINELVSLFFLIIWIVLAVFYLTDNELLCFSFKSKIAWKEFIITIAALFVIWQMLYQHGIGMFQDRTIQFYRRKTSIKEKI